MEDSKFEFLGITDNHPKYTKINANSNGVKIIKLSVRFLNEYNLSLVLILNREITDGECGNNSYKILKFRPILSLANLIKRILKKKWCTRRVSFCLFYRLFRNMYYHYYYHYGENRAQVLQFLEAI